MPTTPTPAASSAGMWCAHPDESPAWPPSRNGPCWCDSGRKYRKCCGAPARN
ncbi:SEC-C metal-binding domain-containing protein [Streptomyces mirabilis]|uniref:SEC-C metal-binding domain-containing protein n=1 Tax=Streptomyces mirabilis TaxID=68239 RepID=UPI003661D366